MTSNFEEITIRIDKEKFNEYSGIHLDELCSLEDFIGYEKDILEKSENSQEPERRERERNFFLQDMGAFIRAIVTEE